MNNEEFISKTLQESFLFGILFEFSFELNFLITCMQYWITYESQTSTAMHIYSDIKVSN